MKESDTFAKVSAGKASSMPGTLRGRKGVLTKLNVHFGTKIQNVNEVESLPAMCFSDESMAMFIISIGESMGHGKSAMKTVNAAMNEWLVKRGLPRYSDPSHQHMYPKVIEALRVSINKYRIN